MDHQYIAVNKKNCVYLPHTAGRYARKRFRKVAFTVHFLQPRDIRFIILLFHIAGRVD